MFKHEMNNIAGMLDYFRNKAQLGKLYTWYRKNARKLSTGTPRPYYPFIMEEHVTIKATGDRWTLTHVDQGDSYKYATSFLSIDYVDEGGRGFITVRVDKNTGGVCFKDFRPHCIRAYEHRHISDKNGSRVFNDVKNSILADIVLRGDTESGNVLYSVVRSGIFLGFRLSGGQYDVYNTFISTNDTFFKQRQYLNDIHKAFELARQGRIYISNEDFLSERFQGMTAHDLIEYINPKSGKYFESANKQNEKLEEEWKMLLELKEKEGK